MKNDVRNTLNKGMNLGDGLQLLFIGLKLTHNIDWSWWLVLLPIWIRLVVGVIKATAEAVKETVGKMKK